MIQIWRYFASGNNRVHGWCDHDYSDKNVFTLYLNHLVTEKYNISSKQLRFDELLNTENLGS